MSVQVPEPLFSISKEMIENCEVVSLHGELDMLGAPELAEAINAFDGSGQQVIVDLTGLSFIDSHGLHALVSVRPGGERVILVCPDGSVSRVLEIVQVSQAFRVYKKLDDLLAELREQSGQDGHDPAVLQ